jgi:hypothetical protein
MYGHNIDHSGEGQLPQKQSQYGDLLSAASESTVELEDRPSVLGIVFWVALALVAVINLVLTFPGFS